MFLMINSESSGKKDERSALGKLALICLVTCGVLGCGQSTAPPISSTAAKVESRGLMPKEAYERVVTITRSVEETGEISETDLKHLLSMLEEPLAPGENSYRRLRAAAGLALIQKYSSDQKERIWSATKPLFKSSDVNDQRGAEEIAGSLMNREAVPLLVPLLDSPHDNVKSQAKKVLEMHGFTDFKKS